MGMFGGPREGSWWLECKSDPRWKGDGRTTWLCCSGIPPECKKEINKLTKKYGEPPSDLTYGFMKD